VSGGGAYRVAAGIFLSRISGLIRERVFAYYFGASLYADVWRASLKLPNILQNLLGEGTLSASFIPLYAEYLEEGREEDAGRFAGAVLGLLLVTVGLVVLIGYLLAPLIVTAFFPLWEPGKRSLTIGLVRILLLMAGTLVLSAWALGILNSHRRFFLSYVAPVLWNAAMIAAMIAGGLRWGLGQRDLVIALAWGAVVGGLLQLGVQLPWVIGALRGFRLRVSTRVEGVREAIQNFLPVVAARGVVNISGYVDLVLAGLLTGGALALLGYAQTLYLLPISLFGMSVAAAELPELSRNRKAELGGLNRQVSTAVSRVTYFVWPTTLGYVFLGDSIVAGLFQTGAFGADEVVATYLVLAGYSVGLLASSRSRVLSSAFYALRDTRTPAKISYLRVALSAVIGAAVMFPLDRFGIGDVRFGAVGLALGASVGAWVEYRMLKRRLGEALGPLGRSSSRTKWIRFGAAVLGLAVAEALELGVGSWVELHPVLEAVVVVGAFAGIYLLVTRTQGAGPETAAEG
jgi:putative peptidoglycan lipid II flippase